MPHKFSRLMSAAIEARQRLESNVTTPTETTLQTIGRLAIVEEISPPPVEEPSPSTTASIGGLSLKLAQESA